MDPMGYKLMVVVEMLPCSVPFVKSEVSPGFSDEFSHRGKGHKASQFYLENSFN